MDKDTIGNQELTFYGDCSGHEAFCMAAQGESEELPQEKDYEVEILNRFRRGRAIATMRVNELLIKSANPDEREKLILAVESLRKKEYIPLCEEIIRNNLNVIEAVKDEPDAEHFSPQRINYVCKLPDKIIDIFDERVWEYPFDKTFEIQIRTVFSEGWHEVEHDFRYKCKNEWIQVEDLNRAMNGVFATLENCDWTLARILHQMAYHQYKEKQWISMLKNVLLVRISDCKDMKQIIQCMDSNPY